MQSPEDPTQAKRDLREALEQGQLSLGEAVRRMRRISGLNQKDYARRIVGISPRILAEVERDEGNPTLDTLNKIARPFGYRIHFVPRAGRTIGLTD